MKKSYYELTHPESDEEKFWREWRDATRYDERHLRMCVDSLVNKIVAEMRSAEARNTCVAYRASLDWKGREDCFKYLAIKVSILGKGEVQVRCWADVRSSKFKESGPCDTFLLLTMAESELQAWLQTSQAKEDILQTFQFLIKGCYKHS